MAAVLVRMLPGALQQAAARGHVPGLGPAAPGGLPAGLAGPHDPLAQRHLRVPAALLQLLRAAHLAQRLHRPPEDVQRGPRHVGLWSGRRPCGGLFDLRAKVLLLVDTRLPRGPGQLPTPDICLCGRGKGERKFIGCARGTCVAPLKGLSKLM